MQGANPSIKIRYPTGRLSNFGHIHTVPVEKVDLARENGMTPTEMALAFCYTKWQVASTIIGVTSVAQLDTDLDVWGKTLSPEVLAAIDAIRWEMRDPAL